MPVHHLPFLAMMNSCLLFQEVRIALQKLSLHAFGIETEASSAKLCSLASESNLNFGKFTGLYRVLLREKITFGSRYSYDVQVSFVLIHNLY